MPTINMQRQIKIHMEFCIPVTCDYSLFMSEGIEGDMLLGP